MAASGKGKAGAKKAAVTENKYLNVEAVRQSTMEALARLELDRHNVEVAVLVHGEDVVLGGEETAKEALARISASIKKIETTYAHILEG